MNVVVHKRIEFPLETCLGFHDLETNTIHVYDRDLLFSLVFEHERIHYERRGCLINRFLELFMFNGSRKRMFCVFVVLFLFLSKLLFSFWLLIAVGLSGFVILLWVLNRYEERVVDAMARKRV